MLEARTSLLEDVLGSLERKESTGYDLEAVHLKVADVKGDMKDFIGGLRRDSFDLYASVRHSVDRSLLAVSRRLKEMLDCEAEMLQQGVHNCL